MSLGAIDINFWQCALHRHVRRCDQDEADQYGKSNSGNRSGHGIYTPCRSICLSNRTRFNPTFYRFKLYPSLSELQLEDINIGCPSRINRSFSSLRAHFDHPIGKQSRPSLPNGGHPRSPPESHPRSSPPLLQGYRYWDRILQTAECSQYSNPAPAGL